MTLNRIVRIVSCVLFVASGAWAAAQTAAPLPQSPDPAFRVGPVLFRDDFRKGLEQWTAEEEKPGKVEATGGELDIDVPAGLTLWFRSKLHGPVMIRYDVTVVSAGGPNDHVTDMNCFWMATDPVHPDDILSGHRTGKFSDYNSLLTYYVGVGGRGNKTTRFRRYIGNPTDRPLRAQDDLSSAQDMIVPNRLEHVEMVADGSLIQYYLNDVKLFEMLDPHPYTSGWFGIRTVHNHMIVRNFRIFRLIPVKAPATSRPSVPHAVSPSR